ncbi:MAG: cytochrome c [Betaproteobacteria bacterium]|nr:cytochrome c [Betaproteobacteria bacterium]
MGKIVLMTFAGLGAVLALAGAFATVVFFGGFVDVSADTPHAALVFDFIEGARERAIRRRARDIAPPADLSDPKRIGRGAGNYQAMCEECHLSPGMHNSELRQGLYPTPPDLTKAPTERMPDGAESARRFWIIKHGIKASAMPAWSKGGMEDSAIWDLTAFLGRLPALSAEQYQGLVAASAGHAHSGVVEKGRSGTSRATHVDKPGSKHHTH